MPLQDTDPTSSFGGFGVSAGVFAVGDFEEVIEDALQVVGSLSELMSRGGQNCDSYDLCDFYDFGGWGRFLGYAQSLWPCEGHIKGDENGDAPSLRIGVRRLADARPRRCHQRRSLRTGTPRNKVTVPSSCRKLPAEPSGMVDPAARALF